MAVDSNAIHGWLRSQIPAMSSATLRSTSGVPNRQGGGAAMSRNGGGQPTDTILTLEEALRRFKRKQSDAGGETRGETGSESNVRHVDFSTTAKREGERTTTSDLETADDSASASVSAQRDEANAAMAAGEDIVALIEGIPRTLE